MTDLLAAAHLELRTREVHLPQQVAQRKRTADDAGRSIAAWRAIVELLQLGSAEPEACLGETNALAWGEIVAAAHAAVGHRAAAAIKDPTAERQAQLAAVRQIRSVLIRSAIRQGAQLPSFDPAPEPERKAA